MDKSIIRAYYHQCTRGPSSGTEREWQRKLTELDSDLHLRWNWQLKSWAVYYDHNGLLSSIRSFKLGEPFGPIYRSIKRNGYVSKRDLIFEHKRSLEDNERVAEKILADIGHEAKRDFHNIAVNKVTTTLR